MSLKIPSDVEGWLFDPEAQVLYELAREVPKDELIIEIGSWKGKSTVCLAQGCRDGQGAHVIAVDTHQGSPEHKKEHPEGINTFPEFKASIELYGMQSWVSPYIGTSRKAAAETWQQPIALVFIDGAHEYESVKEDAFLWLPKVRVGGAAMFHDTNWPGPNQLLAEAAFAPFFFRFGQTLWRWRGAVASSQVLMRVPLEGRSEGLQPQLHATLLAE